MSLEARPAVGPSLRSGAALVSVTTTHAILGSNQAEGVRMRHERTLYFPYVTLDEKALAELAGRLQEMAAAQRAVREARLRKDLSRYSKETGEQYDARIKEHLDHAGERAQFSVALADGGLSDDHWTGVWERSSGADVRAVVMKSQGPSGLRVEIRIRLNPDLESYSEVACEDAEVFRAEVGWLEEYLKRHRANERELLAMHTPTGFLLWFVTPLVGVGAVTGRLLAGYSKAGVTASDKAVVWLGAMFMVGMVWGFSVSWVAARVAPRVVIVDAGPYRTLRKSAKWLAVSVGGSAIGAVVLAALTLVLQ